MPMWTLLDVYKIIERKDGCVYKTQKIRSQWYRLGELPQSSGDIDYAPTMRYELFPTGINPNHEEPRPQKD